MQCLIAVFYFSESFSASSHVVNLNMKLWWRCNVSCYLKKKKLYCLLCSLIASYITIFFVIIFFLPLLQDSATTWENTNLKINFINLFIWFIRLSVKFLNNIWHIQNAHEFRIKICFINIVYCIFCICSGMYRVSLF